MESIWQLTGRECPRGDIGKLSNEDIALAIDYRGDEDKMIDALISSGWLEPDPVERLIVHDWPEHADDAVNMRLARSKSHFVRGIVPKLTRLGDKERKECAQFYDSCAPPEPLPLPLPEPPPEPRQSPASSGPPALPPTGCEWPRTAEAVKALDPGANGVFLERLVRTTIQAAISDGKVDMQHVNDSSICAAVMESIRTGPKNHKAGLLLNRVPEIIITWGHNG